MNPPSINKIDEWRQWAHEIVFKEIAIRSISSVKDDICRVGKIKRLDVQNYVFESDDFSKVAAKRLDPLFQLWKIQRIFKSRLEEQESMTDDELEAIMIEDDKRVREAETRIKKVLTDEMIQKMIGETKQ